MDKPFDDVIVPDECVLDDKMTPASQARAFGHGVVIHKRSYVIQVLQVPTHGVATYVE